MPQRTHLSFRSISSWMSHLDVCTSADGLCYMRGRHKPQSVLPFSVAYRYLVEVHSTFGISTYIFLCLHERPYSSGITVICSSHMPSNMLLFASYSHSAQLQSLPSTTIKMIVVKKLPGLLSRLVFRPVNHLYRFQPIRALRRTPGVQPALIS